MEYVELIKSVLPALRDPNVIKGTTFFTTATLKSLANTASIDGLVYSLGASIVLWILPKKVYPIISGAMLLSTAYKIIRQKQPRAQTFIQTIRQRKQNRNRDSKT